MLPPVRGRHRDRVLASARKTRAVDLKLQGLTYQQVADHLGYANKGTVYRIIRDAQADQLSEVVAEQRQLELDRLDAVQEALWPQAMEGNVEAAEAVRRLVETRCRLLGLVGRRRAAADGCVQPQTVVLQVEDCRTRGCPQHT